MKNVRKYVKNITDNLLTQMRKSQMKSGEPLPPTESPPLATIMNVSGVIIFKIVHTRVPRIK